MIDEDEQGGRHLQKAKVSLQDFEDVDLTSFLREVDPTNFLREVDPTNFRREVDPINFLREVDLTNFLREADFDDIDDFEKQIDFDTDMQTDDKFKNELLFAVQGLGSTKKQYDLEFYMKGPHCEDALKDIIRFCKRDDDEFPVTRIELGKWEVLQKDLIQLLVSQVQDKKLTFYLLMLFTQLTEFPKKSCTRRNELIGYLQSYKFAFGTNSNAIHTINLHLADFFLVKEDERPKIYDQMIEMIVIIYKNLLKVPDNNTPDGFISQRRDLQPKFITTLYKQKTLDAFVFIVQQASPVLMNKLNLYLLEIFYHLFSSFEPMWLFQKIEQDNNPTQQIRDKEKRDKLSEMSTRQARLDCNIKVVRTFNSGSKIIHNPFKNDCSTKKPKPKPKPRKFHEKNASIFPNSHDENDQHGSLKQIIREVSVDFVEHAYDKLIENLYEDIHNNPAKMEEDDKIYFFFIMAYGLEVFRLHFYSRKENIENVVNEEEFSVASVGAALQLTVFEFIQSNLMKQVACAKKKDFSPRLFHSALYSFLQLLYCVRELRLTIINQIARKSRQILMQKVFSQDNANMLRKGFDHYKPNVHDPKLGETLAEFVGVFFDELDEYSKRQVLAKDKRRKEKEKPKAKKDKKKKNKKKNFRIEKDQTEIERSYIAEVKRLQKEKGYGEDEVQENELTGEPTPAAVVVQEQHTLEEEVPATVGTEYTVGSTLQSDEQGGEDKSNNSEEDDKISEDLEEKEIPANLDEEGSDIESDEEDYPQFKERIVNFASELAFVADYQVVKVLLNMIRADKLESNNQKINNAVASFMKKIVTVLKADWLFFQVDFLLIFQDILNIQNPKIRVQNQPLFEIINLIVKGFFALFRKNKLLSVECLFRFSDRLTLNAILANYAEPGHEKEAPASGGGDIEVTHSLWDEKSDMVLIQNYEDYQNLPDCEAQLCLLFNKMNVNDFSIQDIKRRVKFLELQRGKLRAQEIFNETYKDSIRMSIEQALAEFKFAKDDLIAFLVNILEQ